MRGVTFGNKHSYHEWGLLLTSTPIISPPKPKLKYADIPGMDGSIDLSTVISGKIRYESRDIRMEFSLVADRSTWADTHSDILSSLQGQLMNIIFDDDVGYYYRGRITVEEIRAVNNKVAALVITAKVEPYKKPVNDSVGEGAKL